MTPSLKAALLATSGSLAASIVAKVTLITALALFAAWLARRSRAAVRHALLAAAFGVTLLLPLASILVPPVRLAVPVSVEHRTSIAQPLVSGVEQIPPELIRDHLDAPAISAPRGSKTFSLPQLLLTGWITGGAIFLLPVVIGLWQIRLLRRSGLPWRRGQALAQAIALDAGVRRRVEVLLHEDVPGPMTCGFVHPAIVLPPDADRWKEEDLNRAFVHELEHIRRGDSLSRSLARVACAAYWFHPLVWIAWRRLGLEAERSCDDAVLRRSEPTAYADQLVGLARRFSAEKKSPLLALVDRSDLATRVRAVLDARQSRGRAGALSLGLATTTAMVLVISMSPLILVAMPQAAPTQTIAPPPVDAVPPKSIDPSAQAQPREAPDRLRLIAQAQPQPRAPEASPAFEVISVKPLSPKPSGFQGVQPACKGTHFAAITPVFITMEWAYDLQTSQQVAELREKLPLWAQSISGSYELEATMRAPVTEQQCKVMAQKLFEDRFHFKYHWDTITGRVYEMVVARGGFKMPLADPNDPASNLSITINGVKPQGPPADFPVWQGTTMDDMASRLSGNPERLPVINKTGIQGKYKLKLGYSFGGELNNPFADPDLITAAEQQLGLKLQEARGPVAHFVVDSIEKPDPN